MMAVARHGGDRPVPVVTTFAVSACARWSRRASIAYTKRNVKIVASHPGLDVGPTAVGPGARRPAAFRAIPGMTVLARRSAREMALATAAADFDGPVYMRTGRSPARAVCRGPCLPHRQGSHILRDGHDVTLIACGVEVACALEAASLLAAENISARVVNTATIKPIDADLVARCAEETGAIVTAEDHNVIGGLAARSPRRWCAPAPARSSSSA